MKQYSYIMRIMLVIDSFFNVLLLNGSEDHTISGRVGYHALTTGKWYWLLMEKIINTLFWFDPDHCRSSIESDEYKEYPLFSYNIITWLLLIWGIYETVK